MTVHLYNTNHIKMKTNNLLFFIYLINIFFLIIGNTEGILRGKNAAEGSLLYHASLFIREKYACGGAILNPHYVLTAAQCLIDQNGNFLNEQISILFGVTDFNNYPFNRKSRRVVEAYVPYEFRPCNHQHSSEASSSSRQLETGDIAVLKVMNPLGSHYVDLPKAFKRPNSYPAYVNKQSFLSGFGTDIPTGQESASNLENLDSRQNSLQYLNYLTAIVYRVKSCLLSYPDATDAHVCARSYHPDISTSVSGACHGDIGGPLVTENNIVIGILSHYIDKCDERYKPSIYTKVSYFVPFINDAIRGKQTSDIRLAIYSDNGVKEQIHSSRMADLIS